MAKSRERQSDRHYITFPSACCTNCTMWCWKMFKWFPVLLIISIVGWSYYAYVVQLCFYTVDNPMQQIAYLIVYHISLIMFLWAYLRTIFAGVGPLPEKYKLSGADVERLLSSDTEEAQRVLLEEFAKDLPIYTRTSNGSLRYCNRCVLIKPDRSHHCSICSQCVLKMDHHCPWVNNCVCYHNYKFFILFLGYALIYCTWIWTTCFPYFISFWKGELQANVLAFSYSRYHVVFAFFVGLMFGISIGTLFIYHCYLVYKNRTTLESFRAPSFRGGPDKNGFSLGGYKNFKEVFGDVPHLWLLPVFTSLGDGLVYPVRREHQLETFNTQEGHGYDSMGTTRASTGDGIVFPLPRRQEDSESLLNCEIWDRWEDRRRQYDANVDSSSYDEL